MERECTQHISVSVSVFPQAPEPLGLVIVVIVDC